MLFSTTRGALTKLVLFSDSAHLGVPIYRVKTLYSIILRCARPQQSRYSEKIDKSLKLEVQIHYVLHILGPSDTFHAFLNGPNIL